MSGPTPGPWEQDGTGVYKEHENGYSTVAQCFDYAGGPDVADGVTNARLIAAAPELLEAAEAVMQTDTEPCTCGEAPYEPCSYCAPFDKLRAAIAKAKGSNDG